MRIGILLLAIFFIGCSSNKKGGPHITGDLKNGAQKKIYFEVVLADKDSVIDSTVAGGNGEFSMTNSATKLDYYLLRSGEKNLAYLILKGGESIHITGDANNLDKTYTVTGSDETTGVRGLGGGGGRGAEAL